MGGVVGCQVSNLLTAAWLVRCCKKNHHFYILDQRDIATVDDEDHAHFFVGQILGVLKEGNRSNRAPLVVARSWLRSSRFGALHRHTRPRMVKQTAIYTNTTEFCSNTFGKVKVYKCFGSYTTATILAIDRYNSK